MHTYTHQHEYGHAHTTSFVSQHTRERVQLPEHITIIQSKWRWTGKLANECPRKCKRQIVNSGTYRMSMRSGRPNQLNLPSNTCHAFFRSFFISSFLSFSFSLYLSLSVSISGGKPNSDVGLRDTWGVRALMELSYNYCHGKGLTNVMDHGFKFGYILMQHYKQITVRKITTQDYLTTPLWWRQDVHHTDHTHESNIYIYMYIYIGIRMSVFV